MTNLDQGRASDFDIDGMIRQADTTPFPSLLASALNELKTMRTRDAELRAKCEEWEREASELSHPGTDYLSGKSSGLFFAAAEIRKILGGTMSKPITTTEWNDGAWRDHQWSYEELLNMPTDGGDLIRPLVLRCIDFEAENAKLRSIIHGVMGALSDAGNVPCLRGDGRYDESVRALTRERDWYALLARVAMDYDVTWREEYMVLCIPCGPLKLVCEFKDGLPVETSELRSAIEAAIGGEK